MKITSASTTRNKGFTLLELVIAAAIATMMLGWALPSYRKLAWQGEVDRYTQMVESGLFNLRADLGVDRSNCCINFAANSTTHQGLGTNQFGEPLQLLEFFDPTTKTKLTFTDNPLEACSGQRLRCLPHDVFTDDYRLISLENSTESNAIEVATLTSGYILSPPGTSTSGEDLTLLIRSSRANHADGLRVRCVLLTGNGELSSGNWNQTGMNSNRACPHDPDSEPNFWDSTHCSCTFDS